MIDPEQYLYTISASEADTSTRRDEASWRGLVLAVLEAVARATRRNATSATAVVAAQLEIKAMRRGDKVAAAGGSRTCTWEGRAATWFKFWKRK